jgi:hypothetical protein
MRGIGYPFRIELCLQAALSSLQDNVLARQIKRWRIAAMESMASNDQRTTARSTFHVHFADMPRCSGEVRLSLYQSTRLSRYDAVS